MQISVIIAAAAWQPAIAPMLERLARQQFQSDGFEVLLACPLTTDASATAELAWTRAGGPRGSTLRFIQPTFTAPGTWMHYANAALATAGGHVTLFLQPGMLAEPDLLASHVKSHGALTGSGASCVTGRVLVQSTSKPTLWDAMLARWSQSLRRPDRPEADPCDATHVSTLTDSLRRVGGFTTFTSAAAEPVADLICKLRARLGVTLLEQPEAKSWLDTLPTPITTLRRDYLRGWTSVHHWHTSNLWRSAWHPCPVDDDDAAAHLRRTIENDSVICEKMLGWFEQLHTRPVHADPSLAEELAHDAWERSLSLRRWAYRRGVLAALQRSADRPGVFVPADEPAFLSGLALAA